MTDDSHELRSYRRQKPRLHTLLQETPSPWGEGWGEGSYRRVDGSGAGKRFVLFFLAVMLIIAPSYSSGLLHTFVSPNEEEGGRFGWSVSNVDDVNDDGFDDVIIGAYGESPGTVNEAAGRAYVFSGAVGDDLLVLVSPNGEPRGYFGYSVTGIGDTDGDGYSDLVVAAPFENPDSSPIDAGRAYVFSGSNGAVLHTLISPNQETGGYFGSAVVDAGDIDGDGTHDLLVSATGEDPGSSPLNAGRAYLFSGNDWNLIYELTSPAEEENGRFGTAVSGAGDVNGDGFDDMVIGAPDVGLVESGQVYLFSGETGSMLYALDSPNSVEGGRFGSSVASVGDLNDDGFDDFVVGAPAEGETGRAYLFSGETGELLQTLISPFGDVGVAYFGRSVYGVGDLNNDGFDEVTVGAVVEYDRQSWAGVLSVFSGATGEALYTFVSPNEEWNSSGFGWTLSPVGDLNNDGQAEIVVGAYSENPGQSPNDAGRVHVLSYQSNAADGGITTPSYVLEIVGPFPNPTTGPVRLGVNLFGVKHGRVELDLYDALGRRIDAMLFETLNGESRFDVKWRPEETLPSGVYWWRAKAGESTTQKRMVFVR